MRDKIDQRNQTWHSPVMKWERRREKKTGAEE